MWNLLVCLGSVLAEAQIVGTFRCGLLYEVFPSYSDQLSRRVVLGYWYLELACLVRQLAPVHLLPIPGVAFPVHPLSRKEGP